MLIILVMLALALCCCVTTLLGAGAAWLTLVTPVERQEGPAGAPEPKHREEAPVWFDLRAEGTTLIRSAKPARAEVPYRNIGWMIFSDGRLMLQRNAENETRYDLRCVEGARITAHVSAWYDGAYHRASDEVAIDCR